MLKAGFAEVDITPAIGKLMPGGFEPCVAIEPPRGRLKVTAMAVENDGVEMILVSADLLSMSVKYADALRARISARTGVPVANIMLASTHIHTGAAVDYQLWLCPPDEEVNTVTTEGIYQAAKRAWENKGQVKIGVGVGEEKRYSFCRDIWMTDGTMKMNPSRKKRELMVKVATDPDYSVNVMRVDDADGHIKAFLVNYANHPDCNATYKSSFSADFPGALRRNLKRVYGEDTKVLFFNGTAGDINCYDFLHSTDRGFLGIGKCAPEAIGLGLAATVVEVNANIDATEADPYMAAVSTEAVLDRRFATPEQVEWARKVQASPNEYSGRDRAYALDYLSGAALPPTVDFEIQTLRLGPWTIVGLPSEIFTDIGKEIKAKSPCPGTIVVELANGTHGYVATELAHEKGVYETNYCAINACTAPDSAPRIVRHTLSQLQQMAEMEK